ncbi:MAG: DNA double-strand break repair nuclease NurA [Chloroflexia bacterium]
MAFDLARIAPQAEELGRYYAAEMGPQHRDRISCAWARLQELGREEMESAALRSTVRVLARPLEDPRQPYSSPERRTSYRLWASDGSAISPDPQALVRYALLHTAAVGLAFEPPSFEVAHRTQLLFREEEMERAYPGAGEPVPVEGPVVDTMRAYEELRILCEAAQQLPPDPSGRPLLLMTDAVILWTHRGTGPGHEALKEEYLCRSVAALAQLEQAQIPLLSFTSMPRHREVVHTLLALVCPPERQLACGDCEQPLAECLTYRPLLDRDLFAMLPFGTRSPLFQPVYHGDIAWRLPLAARRNDPELCFFYLNTGEIARVELPRWIVRAGLLDTVHAIVLDQCRPGRAEVPGYPLALSLAHHEAVLTAEDRRAVEWLIEEALARHGFVAPPSAKARMKAL